MQFKVCDAVLNLKESDPSSYVVKKYIFEDNLSMFSVYT